MKQHPGEIVKIEDIIAEYQASSANTDLHALFFECGLTLRALEIERSELGRISL